MPEGDLTLEKVAAGVTAVWNVVDSVEKQTKELVRGQRLVVNRLDAIERRLDGHDKRFDAIEHKLDGHDQRFDQIDRRFDRMDGKLDVIVGLLQPK